MDLHKFSLFSQLEEAELERMKSFTTSRQLRSKERISLPRGSDEIYLLEHGLLKLYREDTIDYLKYIYRQWDVIGIMPLLGQRESPKHEIIAITDVTLLTMRAEPLRALIRTNLKFCAAVQLEAAERIILAEAFVKFFHIKNVDDRLLHFLLAFASTIGRQEGDFIVADNILTHQEIAELIATSRQSVNRALNNLRRKNLIQYNADIIGVNSSIQQDNQLVNLYN